MLKKLTVVALMMLFTGLAAAVLSAGQPGTADTVFNRKFVQKIKPQMPYEQLVKVIGSEGKKVGADNRSAPPAVSYHWDGERKSTLDVKVAAGKIVEATVLSPKRKKFSLGKNGELVESSL